MRWIFLRIFVPPQLEPVVLAMNYCNTGGGVFLHDSLPENINITQLGTYYKVHCFHLKFMVSLIGT